ncbi:nucleolar protein NOP56, putative [Schistosoma mansoni]|nr:nucleolar protein NOP56, putative [Schistosoma mansoni]|eukprot:XP_018645649.1 nucleolar protein NOP56, putative [Schistosoma mansoni]
MKSSFEKFHTLPINIIIAYLRSTIYILSCIMIYAIDLPICPRRFAKSDINDLGLMDVGTGLFIYASSISGSKVVWYMNLDRDHRKSVFHCILNTVIPCLLLGLLRTLFIQLSNYHQSITEYGIHWNFFYTVALIRAISLIMTTDNLISNYLTTFSLKKQIQLYYIISGICLIVSELLPIIICPKYFQTRWQFNPRTLHYINDNRSKSLWIANFEGVDMLVLFETAAGYAVFKVHDEKGIREIDDLAKAFEDTATMNQLIQLERFVQFKDTKDALVAASDIMEGKLSKKLKKLLKKLYVKELRDDVLAVADKKLSVDINTKMSIPTVSDSLVQNLMRGIRTHIDNLLPVVEDSHMMRMRLGLAHSLDRYKLKCNPDKIDTMIVQAVGLMDELDKEINNYIMRAKEMYGWHFPELSKIVLDNVTYVKVVKRIGHRTNSNVDLSDLVPDEIASQIREASIVSLGTEVIDEDITMINELCDQVLEASASRTQLHDYLIKRMVAVAPNLTALVGELLGARLIARAGTLVNLAKHPASTVQILGAEKALFRALKTRHNTPKYGLLYHATLVTQSDNQFKGKMSRMLAAKASISARLDALGEEGADTEMGIRARAYLEKRLRQLEAGTFNPKLSAVKRGLKSEDGQPKSKKMKVDE